VTRTATTALLSPGPVDAGAGRAALLRGAAIEAVGTALPARSVHSSAIAGVLGVSEGWIESRTGVRERRVAAVGDRLEWLATEAGRDALDRAGVAAGSLDLVIVATFTADELLPNAAPLVAGALGARNAGALDVGSACTGFLSALALAGAQIEAGRAERALVVGADICSRFTDHADRRTAALFGDGAGAVVVGPAPAPGRIGPSLLRSDSGGAWHIHATRAEALIRMDGHETFKAAVNRLAEVTLEALAAADLGLGDVDAFVYHQANARILSAVGERLGIDADRLVNAIGSLGNTSAASLPLALAFAERDGALAPGARVLLAAFGSGFTWGATTLVWGGADA
jgi:3-oxoacyl-[acyl-carrier-protein] synthase-3